VATVAVGVLLVAGAVRMMVPSSSARTTTSAAGSGLSIVTTIAGVPTSGTTGDAPAPTAAPSTASAGTPVPAFTTLRATTTLAVPVTSGGPNTGTATAEVAELAMLGTETPTYAVVLQSGRYLATSAVAVSGMDTVEVQMPSGSTANAVVIHNAGPIALLDLAESSAPPASHGEPPAVGDVVIVGSPDGGVTATVGDDNEHGYRRLTSEHPLHESGPVYDADGVVVGICTRAQDSAWLVPVLLLDDLAAQQPGTPPLTSTSTSLATSTTSTSTTSTSTSVPSTAVTTSTAAPPSTKAPSTTASPTTAPRTTAVPTTTVPATTG
jgi:hypothetical protein